MADETTRSTTSTAQSPEAAARRCSHARCLQLSEHHLGIRPRAGTGKPLLHHWHVRDFGRWRVLSSFDGGVVVGVGSLSRGEGDVSSKSTSISCSGLDLSEPDSLDPREPVIVMTPKARTCLPVDAPGVVTTSAVTRHA